MRSIGKADFWPELFPLIPREIVFTMYNLMSQMNLILPASTSRGSLFWAWRRA